MKDLLRSQRAPAMWWKTLTYCTPLAKHYLFPWSSLTNSLICIVDSNHEDIFDIVILQALFVPQNTTKGHWDTNPKGGPCTKFWSLMPFSDSFGFLVQLALTRPKCNEMYPLAGPWVLLSWYLHLSDNWEPFVPHVTKNTYHAKCQKQSHCFRCFFLLVKFIRKESAKRSLGFDLKNVATFVVW